MRACRRWDRSRLALARAAAVGAFFPWRAVGRFFFAGGR
ncbi:hypothetical protein BH20ACT1_BH20ACT1_07470 [soil metagenome]